MILSNFFPLSKIRILATDIDLDAIEKAKQGIYLSRSVKDLPAEYLKKYFVRVGEETYKISDDIKKMCGIQAVKPSQGSVSEENGSDCLPQCADIFHRGGKVADIYRFQPCAC